MKGTMRLLIVLAVVGFYATVEAKPKENSNVDVDIAIVREDECSKGQCFPEDVCPSGNTADQCVAMCQKHKCCKDTDVGSYVKCVKKAGRDKIYCNCSPYNGEVALCKTCCSSKSGKEATCLEISKTFERGFDCPCGED